MNIENKIIFINSNPHSMRDVRDEIMGLVYLDYPFNSNAHYEVPVRTDVAGTNFSDIRTCGNIRNEEQGLLAETYLKCGYCNRAKSRSLVAKIGRKNIKSSVMRYSF